MSVEQVKVSVVRCTAVVVVRIKKIATFPPDQYPGKKPPGHTANYLTGWTQCFTLRQVKFWSFVIFILYP